MEEEFDVSFLSTIRQKVTIASGYGQCASDGPDTDNPPTGAGQVGADQFVSDVSWGCEPLPESINIMTCHSKTKRLKISTPIAYTFELLKLNSNRISLYLIWCRARLKTIRADRSRLHPFNIAACVISIFYCLLWLAIQCTYLLYSNIHLHILSL